MTKRDTLSQTLDTVLSMNDSEREHELESMGRVQRWKADGLVTTGKSGQHGSFYPSGKKLTE